MSIKKNSITVGIPFYEKTNPKYFEMAINSIIKQTLTPDSIHLIQDGEVGQELVELINKYNLKLPVCILFRFWSLRLSSWILIGCCCECIDSLNDLKS